MVCSQPCPQLLPDGLSLPWLVGESQKMHLLSPRDAPLCLQVVLPASTSPLLIKAQVQLDQGVP